MKPLLLLLLSFLAIPVSGQQSSLRTASAIDFHVFYTDFNTVGRIRSSSLGTVLEQKRWSKISDMQMGIGLSYLKGIGRNLDAVATVDGSYADYLYQDGTTAGSSRFLLDINVAANIKMLSDSFAVVPYISGGAGFSLYNGKSGFYLPVGAGLRFNVFNEAAVLLNMQYRIASGANVADHFRYGIGIATSLGRKKKVSKVISEPQVIIKEIAASKNITITVTDEATGQPLPYVDVVISGPEGKKLSGSTDANGQVIFNELPAADYTVTGMLNGINTTAQYVPKDSFGIAGKEIGIRISHNDPRFTLSGVAMNKTTGKPEGSVEVSIANELKSTILRKQSRPGDGGFQAQLEAGSDFTIIGKKASYISNIEKVSTKGLSRSATLYVRLELLVEEATAGKAIVLSNIYYDLGSSVIRSSASSDLEKLAQFLKDNPALRIEIASHTDSRGSDAANLKLSKARAMSVADYLMKKGISGIRLVAKGYGETKPVNGCTNGVPCTEAQHQENRRTEFKLID